MKKNSRVAITAFAAAMMVTGAASFAYAGGQPSKQVANVQLGKPSFDHILSVNGMQLADAGYLNKDAKTVMLPLRALATALGYNVTWNAKTGSVELVNGPQWTSLKPGVDRYSFAKKHIELGIAPEARTNGKVYVPDTFASLVLHAVVDRKDNQVTITTPEEEESMTTEGIVTGIQIKDGKGQIHINGTAAKGLILNIGEKSKISDVNGKEVKWSDLLLGMRVQAVHTSEATDSLPPQALLYELKVKTRTEAAQMLATAGRIEAVSTSKEGVLSIVVKGEALSEDSQREVNLRIGRDAVIETINGDKADAAMLVKGARVIGFHGPELTKSLPPIGLAWKIVIQPDA
ncbi:copper amine oxidase N-terminal domain-containing protein [Paenibacillus spongiae]|uniref:Copper amine oxidase N-terminal domain-containing protein n=1 Tax=Paenibacillus spongiae TaxID=2909671 RepID=A0ABY5S3S1_9BACL|nr:copper amine oxidase N-terminal domain-containing protein [Paenibacillus spongiae]UVI28220.1 copper amine oxidase N-terminal domain-containing protein [Paenibacillus spongiae]